MQNLLYNRIFYSLISVTLPRTTKQTFIYQSLNLLLLRLEASLNGADGDTGRIVAERGQADSAPLSDMLSLSERRRVRLRRLLL